MGAKTEDGQLAAKILDEYMKDFQRRNPTLRVFAAHLHMDEAAPAGNIRLSVTNHLLKEQTELLAGDKEKLLSENEKLEKQQEKLQQELNKMVQSKEVM